MRVHFSSLSTKTLHHVNISHCLNLITSIFIDDTFVLPHSSSSIKETVAKLWTASFRNSVAFHVHTCFDAHHTCASKVIQMATRYFFKLPKQFAITDIFLFQIAENVDMHFTLRDFLVYKFLFC